MPWKGESDPYRIWLSEIILQQTRVEQGWAYYERFIKQFPTVHHLANASPQEVYKLWEGLGYYTRCKNLHETARKISGELKGQFPATYDDIRQLKGIGPYTAAAIASFAFGLPYAVVDGNVQRILSRYFGITTPVDTSEGKKLYAELAQSLLDTRNPAKYNQAIMDFGAVICKPQKPMCLQCVQRKDCQAYQLNCVNDLPVKEKSLVKKTRWFNYFILELHNEVFIQQRNGKDIWTNLYEFLLHESPDALLGPSTDIHEHLHQYIGHTGFAVKAVSKQYKQQLTHQTIIGQFITVQLVQPPRKPATGVMIPKKHLSRYAFPKMINMYMNESIV